MIYLIDFDNVHSDGLKGIEQLGEKDKCRCADIQYAQKNNREQSRYILCRGAGGNEKCT